MPKRDQIIKHCLEDGIKRTIVNTSLNILTDLIGAKENYNLHYGRCTERRFRTATRHNTRCSNNKYSCKGIICQRGSKYVER